MTWLPPISKRILINALYISYGICWMVNSTSFDSGRVLVSYSLPSLPRVYLGARRCGGGVLIMIKMVDPDLLISECGRPGRDVCVNSPGSGSLAINGVSPPGKPCCVTYMFWQAYVLSRDSSYTGVAI